MRLGLSLAFGSVEFLVTTFVSFGIGMSVSADLAFAIKTAFVWGWEFHLLLALGKSH